MKAPSISLKKTLDVTMSDTILRIEKLVEKDRLALIAEYKEWLDACHNKQEQPRVLYINWIKSSK